MFNLLCLFNLFHVCFLKSAYQSFIIRETHISLGILSEIILISLNQFYLMIKELLFITLYLNTWSHFMIISFLTETYKTLIYLHLKDLHLASDQRVLHVN